MTPDFSGGFGENFGGAGPRIESTVKYCLLVELKLCNMNTCIGGKTGSWGITGGAPPPAQPRTAPFLFANLLLFSRDKYTVTVCRFYCCAIFGRKDYTLILFENNSVMSEGIISRNLSLGPKPVKRKVAVSGSTFLKYLIVSM